MTEGKPKSGYSGYKKPNRAKKASAAQRKQIAHASRSRGLMKQRITALNVEVSLLNSQMQELYKYFGFNIPDDDVAERNESQMTLLEVAESLGEEE